MALSDFGMTKNDAEYILGSLLHSTILEILAYGIYTSVYCVAMYLILSRGTSVKARVRSAILVTVMWLFCGIRTIIRWTMIDNIFIRHASSREAQLTANFGAISMLFSLGLTIAIVSYLSILFADMTMVWRCWVLHGRRWTVVVTPILSFTLGTVAYIIQAIVHFSSGKVKVPVALSTWKIIFLATTVFTNIFCTVAIIFRIVHVSGFTKSLKTYHGILETLIESASLYTSIYLVHIGLEVYTTYFTTEWDDRYYYPESLSNVITGIAPTLIIASIAAGHTQPDDSWTCTSSFPTIKSPIQSFVDSLRSPLSHSDVNVDVENISARRHWQDTQTVM